MCQLSKIFLHKKVTSKEPVTLKKFIRKINVQICPSHISYETRKPKKPLTTVYILVTYNHITHTVKILTIHDNIEQDVLQQCAHTHHTLIHTHAQ